MEEEWEDFEKNPPPPSSIFRNNNTWFFVLLGATAVTFVIACFNFGPAVLLPEGFPTPGQRGMVKDVFHHLLYGQDAPVKSIPTEPLPWATGTWFWWKAFFLCALITFAYFWYAFHDEAQGVIKNLGDFIKKGDKGDAHDEHDHKKRSHFWAPDFWDLVSMFEIISRIFRKKGGV